MDTSSAGGTTEEDGGVPVAAPMPLESPDVAYVRRHFRQLDLVSREAGSDLASFRDLIRDGRLPGPAYVLPDGAEMVPADYLEPIEQAGGLARLHGWFVDRYRAAANRLDVDASDDTIARAWNGYLSGEYFVCLKRATPEMMVRKDWLIAGIEELLTHPQPAETEWREHLSNLVDELDRIERPFAGYDRVRFGIRTSRDRLITAVREGFPEAFAAGDLSS
jgi:uncharacterized protein DUF6058